MNEGKTSAVRTTPQASGSSTHGITDNGPQTSSSTLSQNQYNANHHLYPSQSKNDTAKIQQSSVQPYKTVQIISQPNHVMSTTGGNCVVVQQVGTNNHAVSFQQIGSSQNSQGLNQGNQTIYRHGNQTFVSTTQNQLQTTSNQPEVSSSNMNPDGSHIQVQNAQLPPRYTSQIHQLQDGRQVQMIQVNNHPYYGQTGQQQITIQQYLPQQQQFLTNNGGQSVLITSQNQDGSRTLQALPAQIHTIQHTVSPQNQAFQLTKTGIRPVTTSRRQESGNSQGNSNGGQVVSTPNQSQQSQSQVYQAFQNSQVGNSPSKPKTKQTPTKTTQKNSPNTQQVTNNAGQPTALIQQIGLTTNSQVRQSINQGKLAENKNVQSSFVQTVSQQSSTSSMPPPPLPQPKIIQNNNSSNLQSTVSSTVQSKVSSTKKSSPQNRSNVRPQVPYQKPVVENFVRNPGRQINSNQKNTVEQQQNQKIHQILQTAAKAQQNTVPISSSLKSQNQIITTSRNPVMKGSQFIVQTPSPKGQVVVPIRAQSVPQVKVSEMKQITVPTVPQGTIQRPAIAVIPTTIAVRTKAPVPKKGASGVPSTYSNAISILGKLNLDLAVGEPKEEYRMLKKHFKYLVYENECYQGQLRDSHQRLLKLERDNNYLMDRLLKYENLSDSEGEESDSSVKTIEDKVVLQKPVKRKPTTKNVFNPPPKKKANVSSSGTPNLTGSPGVGPTSSAAVPPSTSTPTSVSSGSKSEVAKSTSETSTFQKIPSSTGLSSVSKNETVNISTGENVVSSTPMLSIPAPGGPPAVRIMRPSNAVPNSMRHVVSSQSPVQRPIFNKVSAEQINEIKKEGKMVKTMTPAAFKALSANVKGSTSPISKITNPISAMNTVTCSSINVNSESTISKNNNTATVPIVSANVPCPVKKSISQKTTLPKVTVEIKELPPKSEIPKPKDFRPRMPSSNLTKTNSNGSATPPKVYVPFKFMHRNPTPQSRASISYSSIRSPSLARMMGPRGPSRMVRPSSRFQIVSPSPTAQSPQIIKVDPKPVTSESPKGSTESKEKGEIMVPTQNSPGFQNSITASEANPTIPDVSSN